MFRFAQPVYFYLLLVIPVLVVLYYYFVRTRRKNMEMYGLLPIISMLAPNVSYKRLHLKFILFCIAYGIVVLALAQPQFGSRIKEVKNRGVEIVVALDVSNSMLADDFKPNRLSTAKLALSRLVDKLRDDRLGLVVFAGDAYTQLPITSDFAAAKMFFNTISPNMVPQQGTALGKAIDLGIKSFSSTTKTPKVLIVISDGENHEDDPIVAAEEAKKGGVKIYTVGVGQPQGAPIPVSGGFLKDKDGNIVITRLDEKTLQQIATLTGGKYIRATGSNFGLTDILSDVKKMDKMEMKSYVYEDYDDQFQVLLLLALFVLLLDSIIVQTKNIWLSKVDIFKSR
jgi:Ca-activated chloride channel homolog